MARPRDDEDDAVSLFPFLSILSCVIGILTLTIAGLALGQMDTEQFAQAEEYDSVKRQIEQQSLEIEQYEEKLADSESESASAESEKAQQLKKLRYELSLAQTQLKEATDKLSDSENAVEIPNYDLDKMRQEIAQLKSELDEVTFQHTELADEVKERKLPPKPGNVRILPGGSGVGFTPVFVECAQGSVVLLDGEKPLRVRTGDLRRNKEFVALLNRIGNDTKLRLVFLIRPDGLSSFNSARRIVEEQELPSGKLPVTGQGDLDLSVFQQQMRNDNQ